MRLGCLERALAGLDRLAARRKRAAALPAHLLTGLEGEEAAFYESPEELARQVDYYLHHSLERQGVARRGRERCLNGGYSLDSRMQVVSGWFDRALLDRGRA